VTRDRDTGTRTSTRSQRAGWRFQDAKASFTELVNLACTEGPQPVTVDDRNAVVVVDAEHFRRLEGQRTGQLLIDALQASPHRDIDLALARSAMPVRDVDR
jgi:prevent-host-death family protein